MFAQRLAQVVGVGHARRRRQKRSGFAVPGHNVVDFTAGEPDFPTPSTPRPLARRQSTRTSPVTPRQPAFPSCVKRSAPATSVEYGIDITSGGSAADGRRQAGALQHRAGALRPGRRSHHARALLADDSGAGEAGGCDAGHRADGPDDGFGVHAEAVVAAITPRTKAIIINSPCNPTGGLVDEATLTPIVDAAAKRGIWIVVDLCYEQLIYEEVPHNLPKVLVRSASRSDGDRGVGVEVVRDDGMALRLDDCAEGADRGVQHHSGADNVEHYVDYAEGGACGDFGAAGRVAFMLNEYRKRRDNIHAWLTAASGDPVRQTEGRLLPLPGHLGTSVARRDSDVRRLRRRRSSRRSTSR